MAGMVGCDQECAGFWQVFQPGNFAAEKHVVHHDREIMKTAIDPRHGRLRVTAGHATGSFAAMSLAIASTTCSSVWWVPSISMAPGEEVRGAALRDVSSRSRS